MSTTQESIRTTVLKFLQTNFVFDEKKQIAESESLIGAGIVDSTGILEVISFLEETYGVRFLDDELIAENFDSLERIVSFMKKKIETPEGGPGVSA
jgi:acyl carrier protein